MHDIIHSNFLNQYFDHIYVVNLKHAISDKLKVSNHLKKYGIHFEIFQAVNGFTGKARQAYDEYQKNCLGDLKRYPEYSDMEIKRGKHWIDSPGVMGYIFSYLQILEDAKNKKYKRFLILEDDILLSKDFDNEFKIFIKNISNDWKILLLGTSQDKWENVDLNLAEKNGFYFPRSIITQGSFALALDHTIIDDLIEVSSTFEAPFDYFTIGELYEKYLGKCFVAYPNIIIPDVSKSSMRESKCQYNLAKLMQWPMINFDYPLNKPSISIIITSKNNLKYYSNFSNEKNSPYNLRLFINTRCGFRPLHTLELLDIPKYEIQPLDDSFLVTTSDYTATIAEEYLLTEYDISNFLEYKLKIKKTNHTKIKEIKSIRGNTQKDRVSVIIIISENLDNFENSLTSVLSQDYSEIELILVTTNNHNTEQVKKNKEILSLAKKNYPTQKIHLVNHTLNQNIFSARNTGVKHATGEYICFLDNSNIYLQGKLSKTVAKLKTTRKPVEAVYCELPNKKDYNDGDLSAELLSNDDQYNHFYTDTLTYKKEVILALNGFNEFYSYHQDLEFNLRFFNLYTVESVKETLVQPLNTEDRLKKDISNMESLITIKRKLFNQFSYLIENLDFDIIQTICQVHSIEELNYYYHQKNKKNESNTSDTKRWLNYVEDIPKNINFVKIVESDKIISFTILPKTNNKQAAFYLYHNDIHIDTQWYSSNMSYSFNKMKYKNGNFYIKFFLVNKDDKDPGKNANKEIGISETISISHNYNLINMYTITNYTNLNKQKQDLVLAISTLTKISIWENPIQKFKAYKKLLSLYLKQNKMH